MIKLTQFNGAPFWVRIDAIDAFAPELPPAYEKRTDPGCYVHACGEWRWVRETVQHMRAFLSAPRGVS